MRIVDSGSVQEEEEDVRDDKLQCLVRNPVKQTVKISFE